MNLIVVGRNSYIGGHFAEYASRRGARVIGLSSAECNFLCEDEVVDFFRSLDGENYRIAFFAVVNKSADVSYESFLDNLQIVRNLMVGCRYAPVVSIAYFSSVDVYGAGPILPIDEETKLAPDTWYGLAKQGCEWMLSQSGEVDCPVTILRIPGIYGCAKNDRSVIGRLIKSAVEQGQIHVHGSGDVLRDYVYVEDVSRLLYEMIPMGHDGTLNLVTGKSYSLVELVDKIRKTLDLQVEIIHGAEERGRNFDLVFDRGGLVDLLPDFNFSDIETAIESYRPVARGAEPKEC